MLYGLSLGNLGDKEQFWLAFKPERRTQKIQMYCNTGVIGSIKHIGYAKDLSDGTGTIKYQSNSWCDLSEALSSVNQRKLKDCYDREFCNKKLKIDFVSEITRPCINQERFPGTTELR